MYRLYVKRLSDIMLSMIGLLAVSPVFLVLLMILALTNKGKSFFIQVRPGKDGELFKIIKFRTMKDVYDSSGNYLPDNQRFNHSR
jgi:undecaprenyl phosphate N,N'-diacetylbacillosamine 1-phosphate transferase